MPKNKIKIMIKKNLYSNAIIFKNTYFKGIQKQFTSQPSQVIGNGLVLVKANPLYIKKYLNVLKV